jgi:integrase
MFKNGSLTQTLYNNMWAKGSRYKAVLKLILETCYHFDIPSFKYKIIKDKPQPHHRPITYSEENILKIANRIEHYGLLVRCAYYIGGGLRFGSTIMLKWEDFNWNEWVLDKELVGKCDIFGKGNKEDTLDVDPILMKELYNLSVSRNKCFLDIPYKNYAGNTYMFIDEDLFIEYQEQIKKKIFNENLNSNGKNIFPVNVKRKARNMMIAKMHRIVDYRLLKLNNMFNKKIKFHSIRSSKATHLLKMGFRLSDIQNMLMHKDISTTQIYVNVDKEEISDRYNEMVKNRQNE